MRKMILSMLLLCLMLCESAMAVSISFTQTDLCIDLWGEKKYAPKIVVEPAGTKPKFSTSNKRVATVNKSGKITAKKKGVALITASIDGASATLPVTVVKPAAPKKLVIGARMHTLEIGQQLPLELTALPLGRSLAVRWTSSNPKVCKVSADGVVTALKKGNATIRARSHANASVSGTVKLAVISESHPIQALAPDEAQSIPTKLYGVCFGPYLTGPKGAPLSEERIRELLGKLVGVTTWIRTYGVTGDLGKIPVIAKQMGFKVMAGAWLERDKVANAREIEALKELIDKGVVDCALVGSEVMLRGDLSVSALIAHMDDVRRYARSRGSDVPVCTADVFTTFEQNPKLAAAGDWMVAHIYPFWDNAVPASRAGQFLLEKTLNMVALAAGRPVVIGESGWPSGYQGVTNARANPGTAEDYLRDSIAMLRGQNIPYLVFEAFDEAFKVEGGYGNSFGLFDGNANPKYPALLPSLSGALTAPSGVDVVGLSIPKYGDLHGVLGGRVIGASAAEVQVAVYLRADISNATQNYYVKPSYEAPLTKLDRDGRFRCRVDSGGAGDSIARQYAICILPASVKKEQLPQNSLPTDLALKIVMVTREP